MNLENDISYFTPLLDSIKKINLSDTFSNCVNTLNKALNECHYNIAINKINNYCSDLIVWSNNIMQLSKKYNLNLTYKERCAISVLAIMKEQ